jgi:hypothetical protein
MSTEQEEEKYIDDAGIDLHKLPYPGLPDFALAYQTMSVIEDRSYADPNLHEVY